MPHKAICPLLKKWRKVDCLGTATRESAGLQEAMVEYLRAAVSAPPGGRAMAGPSAGVGAHGDAWEPGGDINAGGDTFGAA